MLLRNQIKMTMAATLNALALDGTGANFVDVKAQSLVGVFVTATHTGVINILVACDDGTYYPLRTAAGTAVTIVATSGSGFYSVILDTSSGIQKVQFQAAGTEASIRTIYPVLQQVN
jgi:hypothetical protein